MERFFKEVSKRGSRDVKSKVFRTGKRSGMLEFDLKSELVTKLGREEKDCCSNNEEEYCCCIK